MDKVWNHKDYEEKIYQSWEKNGSFLPKVNKGKKSFSIIMPPPNANADLHIGHARFITIQDILIRYHRMKGDITLWLPGADHAGIETQYVFEKKLKENGKSRFDFKPEKLYQLIWDYVQENKKNMEKQIRSLGASCDWSRNKFTLDPKIVKIVYKTFKKLYDDGLVYRGKRIVNFCTRCGTAYSQLEIDTREQEDNLYYIDYKNIIIATTRPETIFADVAVAVNPNDKRYKEIIGKKATIPIIEKEIPIIKDSLVDKNFGTGALKITPGHDPVDFEVGQKHNLEIILVINEQGRMINTPERYLGLPVEAAREKVVEDLKKQGKIKKIEKIKHLVATCYRDKSLIEPLPSEQWFVKTSPLAKEALKAIKEKKVSFVSKKYEKIAIHWLKNLKDWNISRQIVWGIRIPAWFCKKCNNWTITEGEKPKECSFCKSKDILQDKDTFDTWFSSGQWPYATLLASKKTDKIKIPINQKDKKKYQDFNQFYPTSIMETGYDIIPFWVIRMVMLGLYATGDVPFREVLIHGLVRDKQGQKISKSKGNVINPLEMSAKYGTDALRIAMIWGAKIENDISLSEENIRGQRNFANKIWNIARFITLVDNNQKWPNKIPDIKNKDDVWIWKNLKETVKKTTKYLESYQLNEAAQEIYQFVWHKLADIYIEKIKIRNQEGTAVRKESLPVLQKSFEISLKLLHPFAPFITEAVWKELEISPQELITNSWPEL
jgi:valyl-tRNA synthetase